MYIYIYKNNNNTVYIDNTVRHIYKPQECDQNLRNFSIKVHNESEENYEIVNTTISKISNIYNNSIKEYKNDTNNISSI